MKKIEQSARLMIDEFSDWYKQTTGKQYYPNYARDVQPMVYLLENVGAKEVSTLIKDFFSRKLGGMELSLYTFYNNVDTIQRMRDQEEQERKDFAELLKKTAERIQKQKEESE